MNPTRHVVLVSCALLGLLGSPAQAAPAPSNTPLRTVATAPAASPSAATDPVPSPDGLPRRAVRVWDIVPESPREFLPQPYEFALNVNQKILDDVRFKVGLYSVGGPENKKYVVVSTYGGAGVSAAVDGSTIEVNSSSERGYYLERYEVQLGPSDEGQTGLQIESRAPEAENSQGSYSSSTGFAVGGTAGFDAGLGAEYSQSNVSTVNIPDFAVRYTASSTQAKWTYALASVGGAKPYGGPGDLVEKVPTVDVPTGKLLSLPGLATGQALNPRNQAVWSIAGNYQGTISFTVKHRAFLRRAKLSGGGLNYTLTTTAVQGPEMQATFPVDFSLVNYAGDVSVDPAEVSIATDPALPPGYVWLQALVRNSYADYDSVNVSFSNDTNGPPQPIDSVPVSLVTTPGAVRRGAALARVRWNIAGLPGTQTITVRATAQGGELSSANNSLTREINLTAPRVTVSKSAFSLAEGGPTDSYTVQLATRPTADVIIGAVTDGQTSVTPNGLIFTRDNWNTPQTLTIGAVDDSRVEGSQLGQVKYTASSADPIYNSIAISSASVTIADNDNASPSALTLTEGERSSYQFVLNRAPSATVVVSMTASGPLLLVPQSLTFTPASWNIPQTVVIRALDDSAVQSDRSLTIQHRAISADSSYSGVQLAPVSIRLRDNDGPQPTIAVTTAADSFAADGQCSLREALEAANTNATVLDCAASSASYHIINLNAAGPYDLTRQNDPTFPYDVALNVNSTVIINGNGQTLRNRSSTGISRLVKVNAPGDLTINDLTIRDGHATNAGGLWVFAGASASLVRVTVTNNIARSETYGGGIINQGMLNIRDSAITNNLATGNNTINQHGGGGIYNEGDLNIANSTFSGNQALMNGGGLDNSAGRAWLTNVTFSGNTADSDGDGNGAGGGIVVGQGQLIIKNSIIAGNADTPNNAGPAANDPDIARKADNEQSRFLGTIVSQGNNLIGSVGRFNFLQNAAGDQYGDPQNTTVPNIGATEQATLLDARLGALSGSPAAYDLLSDSPAVDRIAPTDCTFASGAANPLFLDSQPIAADQRGAVRPRGLRCDSGATELAQPGVGLTVTALEVPTGRFGSVYQIVLNTQPTSDVTIDLSGSAGLVAVPSRLVFTPANWNVPQTVNIRAQSGAATRSSAAFGVGSAVGVISQRVSSADPAYSGVALRNVAVSVIRIATNKVNTVVYAPLIVR